MLMPGPYSILKLQQSVFMDLTYLHAWHLNWEDKEPGHLGGASAHSSDNDAPAPAPEASALPPAA
jgi:hypothetical protein